ncbi:MAG: beta-ketoacyl-ACP synthase III [Bacteroidota bacterium]
MSKDVYIVKTSHFLPNKPISNDEMEDYLGLINNQPSKSKNIVLRNNGIKNRYYAMDKNGVATHTNSQMAALAVRNIFNNDSEQLKTIDLLCCGTSTPDQLLPSHGIMVHGWLPETKPIEVTSNAGACCSSMHSLKYAWMSIKSGEVDTAVATGSERSSRIMRSENFEEEAAKLVEAEKNPYVSFEKEFLRWMLSDGAGAFLLSNKKNEKELSLKIEFLDGVSFAHEVEPCMYFACDKTESGELKSFMDYTSAEIAEKSILSMKQDVKLLRQHMLTIGIDKFKSVLKKHNLPLEEIDYFLPHVSSEFFRYKMAEVFDETGLHIPQEKWFTNLATIGNIGAGAIYLIVDELLNSGKLKVGQKIVILVPESSRFSYMFGLFTVC